MDETKKNNYLVPGLVVAGVVAVGVVGAINNQDSSAKLVNDTSATVSETVISDKNQYADGDYSATGKYKSPAGDEDLGVTLTLKSGSVVDVKVDIKATNPVSKTKQEEFANNYTTLVVGKNLDEIKLDKVAGSSLTPKGFNDALEQIRSQAKV